MDDKILFGQRLFELRKKSRKSQADVAKVLEISQPAYQNYENGRREAGYATIAKLADYYGVTTDYLLGREPPTDPLAALGITIHEISDDEFIRRYRNLPEDGRKLFLNVMRTLTEGAVIDNDGSIPDGYASITLGELEDMRAAEEAEKQDGGKFA